jgi:steroid delta-isomerase-like uncharacterized protein
VAASIQRSPSQQTQETVMQPNTSSDDSDLIAKQRECVAEHMRAENEHEWDRVYDTFAKDEHVSYDVVPMSHIFRGMKGVVDFYSTFDAAFPDFHLQDTGSYDVPGCSIREVTVTGTHRAEFCGIPATGRRIHFELVAFYIFGDGKDAGHLVNERVYFDLETVLRQLRGEENAPTGVGLHSRPREF